METDNKFHAREDKRESEIIWSYEVKSMRYQQLKKSLCVLIVILLLPVTFLSQDLPKPKEKKGTLRIVVTGNGSAKPVNGADVIVRSNDGEFEESTKTDSEGHANIAKVPRGNLVIQVVALGWKTWGGQHIFKDDKPIPISLVQDQGAQPSGSPRPSNSPTPR